MNDREQPRTYGSLAPEAALSLVGNEVRATILWTLSQARSGGGPPPTLPFSELRERADVDADSSQFNYHLQELVGTFVERVSPSTGDEDAQVLSEMAGEHEDGFRLRPEGTTLIRTIRAWSVPGDATHEPFELDRACYYCETPLVASYENAIFAIRCPDCEFVYDYNLTPPGVLGGDESDVIQRVAEFNRHQRLASARGNCALCAHDLDAKFRDPATTNYPRGDLREALVALACEHCGNKDNLTVGEAMLRDAELVAFCHERGLDVTTTPIWDLEFAATDRHTSVRSNDPWEVALTVSLDGDELELVVDETLSVVERNRR